MNEIEKELNELKAIMGLIHLVYCTSEEELSIREKIRNGQPVPEDVEKDECGTYYRYGDPLLSRTEEDELLKLRLLEITEKQNKSFRNIVKGWYVLVGAVSVLVLTLVLNIIIFNWLA